MGGFGRWKSWERFAGRSPGMAMNFIFLFFFHFWFLFLFIISIGITHKEIFGFLSPNKFFFAEDGRILMRLVRFRVSGFHGISSGRFYHVGCVGLGFLGLIMYFVFGFRLAFPFVLGGKGDLGLDAGAFVWWFEKGFCGFWFGSFVEENVDARYEICRKIRLF